MRKRQMFAVIVIVSFFTGWALRSVNAQIGGSIMAVCLLLFALMLWEYYKKIDPVAKTTRHTRFLLTIKPPFMNQVSFLSLLRSILTVVGSFLVGKNILGNTVDDNVLETLIGAVMTLVSIVWSIIDKSVTTEKLQSSTRQLISIIGGLLIASGKLSPEKLELYLGIATALIPVLLGWLSRKKVSELERGKIQVQELKGSTSKPT